MDLGAAAERQDVICQDNLKIVIFYFFNTAVNKLTVEGSTIIKKGLIMKNEQNRRCFLKQCTQFGFSCLSLLICNKHLFAKISSDDQKKEDIKFIDLEQRSYCGIACEDECELYKATKENNVELKKKVYDKWNWKEKFEIDFDPAKVFCYSCKPNNQILKIGMEKCEVRKCAIANEIESCIQCKNLTSCDIKFWKNWTDFYNHIKELQKQYLTQEGASLVEIKKSN